MKRTLQTLRGNEQGFTLVELAVVMIIIGILIGGILKGQELITNARITSTTSQMEALSAAKNDFQNQYNALPGDMANANTRLPNCAVCTNGNGNGVLGVGVGAAPAGEAIEFFIDLAASGYITQMTGAQLVAQFGVGLPTAPVGGGFAVGQYVTGTNPTSFPNTIRQGVYITLQGQAAAVGAGNGVVTPTQAQRIDTKLDDGTPDTGGVVVDNANGCVQAGAPATYLATTTQSVCSLAYRI
jgi:prepilin-type N-terminal cleavage/methylation domain-containing protein